MRTFRGITVPLLAGGATAFSLQVGINPRCMRSSFQLCAVNSNSNSNIYSTGAEGRRFYVQRGAAAAVVAVISSMVPDKALASDTQGSTRHIPDRNDVSPRDTQNRCLILDSGRLWWPQCSQQASLLAHTIHHLGFVAFVFLFWSREKERVAEKLKLQKEASKDESFNRKRTYLESIKFEKEKQKKIGSKTQEEKRADLCELLGRGC
jgi:hypothetical protein